MLEYWHQDVHKGKSRMNNKAGIIGEGLFEQVYTTLKMLSLLPEQISEDQLDDILKALPSNNVDAARYMLAPDRWELSRTSLLSILVWLEEAKSAREEGRKVILVPFNFPPEIIHAFESASPITSEVLTTLASGMLESGGEEYWDYAMSLGLPDHLCSGNTIELASILAGADLQPDAIISATPGGCDVNAKIHEFVSRRIGIPQFLLEKPTYDNSSRRGREIYLKNFRRLIKDLEEFTGEKLREENLRRVAEKANHASELYYDLWELRRRIPSPIPGGSALLTYGMRFSMWGRDEAVESLEKILEVSIRNSKDEDYCSREEVARLMWVYLPFYYDNFQYAEWLEVNKVTNIGDALLLFYPQVVDTSSLDSILEGFAESAWNMGMTRQMGAGSMSLQWAEDIIAAINELHVDFAIYCGHHSCKQTWSSFNILRNEVKKRTGVPVLCLQGDSWIGRMTPMSAILDEMSTFLGNVVIPARKRQDKVDIERKPKR
jgi:benzoyl-CoA reductase/2-hydroxyglutaryl-CoA dehydratase subunit BcrC/BadD/HgdB